MTVEKLYPRAPLSARQRPCFVTAAEGFLPLGEAVPAPRPAAPLGDTRNPLTPPPPPVGQEPRGTPARGPDRPAGDERAGDTRKLLQGLRAERYRLLSSARTILVGAGKREGLEHPHNFHRTAKCMHINCGQVAVFLAPAFGSAFYGGLVACGSVWTCPVCSAKVQERRRAEISDAIAWAYAAGLQPVLVTLTFPHGRHQKLGQLLRLQAKALALMRQGSPWKRFKTDMGYRGLIRSLELTYGVQSGWHPHTHELWFVRPGADAEGMAREILKHWESACVRAGLLLPEKVEAFRLYAVDVKGWCSAGDYLAKQDSSKHWGADRELAKGGSKAGKSTGKHPFGLLADASTDRRSARLFLAYAIAMKGKRQLLWSPGLKALVGVDEKTDEQIATEQSEEADVLCLVEPGDWQRVRRYQRRAQLLDAAEGGGWPAVLAELARLLALDRAGISPEGGPRRAPTLRSKVLGEHFGEETAIVSLTRTLPHEIQPGHRKEEPQQYRHGGRAQHARPPDIKPASSVCLVYTSRLAPGHRIRQEFAGKIEGPG